MVVECRNMRDAAKTEEADIVVVGAGPAGLIAAREAANRGANVVVLEEHGEVGKPCHCAGLLSLKGLDRLGVPTNGAYVQNKVRGARFFSPSALTFSVEKSEPVACVVDRSAFDKYLAQKATEAGARIILNERVKGLKRGKEGVYLQSENGEIRGKVVVDAEGTSSRILKAIGLKPINREEMVVGVQCDLEEVNVDPNYVELHFGSRTAPKFFAWVIPLSVNKARVGLGCKGGNPKECLDGFVKKRFEIDKSLRREDVRSGLIITGGPVERSFSDRFLVVGDAAGQVKPTTGGGVILGGMCASTAGGVAAEAVGSGDCSSHFLVRYEDAWRGELSGDFRSMLLARRVADRLSDKALDKLFSAVIKENLQGLFSAEGDMDFQSSVILKLLKKREVLGVLPSFLRALIAV